MFRLSYTSPDECQGTIRFDGWPSMGQMTDVEGNDWHIHGWGGEKKGGWCWAVPLDRIHPYFTDTTGNINGYGQTWRPYKWLPG